MDIKDIRTKIDKVDSDILELFLERMALSEKVAAYKAENNIPITDAARERQLLADIKEKAGNMSEYAYYLFSKLIDVSKAHQRELIGGSTKVRRLIENALMSADTPFPKDGTVACQGTEGANSQQACDKLLPRGDIIYVKTFEAVFDALKAGICDYGVLPIENNLNGSVRAVYDLILQRGYTVVRSYTMQIRHELLAPASAELGSIKKILSHPQAIGQCSNFLAALPREVQIVPCTNTAVAAQMAAEDKTGATASISSPECTALYGLKSLSSNIQDKDSNFTKFILISSKPAIYPGSDRISLGFTCPNKAGALSHVLNILASRGVNIIKLESCPIPGRDFEFMFYAELDCGICDPGVISALEELERYCDRFEFIGSYIEI